MSDDELQLVPSRSPQSTLPIEPLYSMLHDAPLEAVEYLHRELSENNSEKALDEVLPELGISRRRAIEQVLLALSRREQG